LEGLDNIPEAAGPVLGGGLDADHVRMREVLLGEARAVTPGSGPLSIDLGRRLGRRRIGQERKTA
jgi:hypothetical protein